MIELMPYSYLEKQNKWSINDNKIISFFHQLKHDKIIQDVFYQGPDPLSTEFIEYLKSPENLPVFAFDRDEPVALGWLNHLNKNYAIGHFCMAKAVWGRESLTIGKLILSYWFSLSEDGETPIYDVILGVTPRSNEKALNFIHKLGFILNGSFPYLCKPMGDGIISYMENPIHGQQTKQRTEIEPSSSQVG